MTGALFALGLQREQAEVFFGVGDRILFLAVDLVLGFLFMV